AVPPAGKTSHLWWLDNSRRLARGPKILWMKHPQTSRLAQALDQEAAVVAALHFEIGNGLDEFGKPCVAIVARREARHRLRPLPELGQRGVALLVALGRLVGCAEDLQQLRINRSLPLGDQWLLQLFLILKREGADIEEPRAGLLERNGGLGRAEAVDG